MRRQKDNADHFNNPGQMKNETIEAMNDPQVGDRFTEMFAFWLYVIRRDGNVVTTMEGSAPVIFPDEGQQRTYTIDEMKDRFGYSSGVGYWVRLVDRNNDVEGWYSPQPAHN